VCDGSVPDSALMEMINDSYDLVFASLSKAEKQALEGER
jgi:predicted DNA-binding protein (MmcQ/YjbR family)